MDDCSAAREVDGGGRSPAILVRFSRFRSTVQQDPVQRQETQIVQSCMTLDDFLPRFRPRAVRPPGPRSAVTLHLAPEYPIVGGGSALLTLSGPAPTPCGGKSPARGDRESPVRISALFLWER